MKMNEDIKKIISKYIDNTISSGELDELIAWRNKSAYNEKEFNEIKRILLLADLNNANFTPYRKRTWERLKQKMEEEKPGKVCSLHSRRKKIYHWMQAASVLLILGIGIAIGATVFSRLRPAQEQIASAALTLPDTVIIQSHASSKSEVILPDGSKVWLNSNSEIRFLPGFMDKREVYLTGEAYFDVRKTNDQRHFYVHTSDIKVQVLGTEFNVKSYPEEGLIETTLEEGEIVLFRKGKEKDIQLTSMKPSQHATFIRKEGKVHLEHINKKFEQESLQPANRKEELILTENVKTKKYTGWKEGNLIIDGESFESFVKKLERWYDVEIVIRNQKVKKLHFTANFKNETIEQALQALKMAHPFEYTFHVDKNRIYIE